MTIQKHVITLSLLLVSVLCFSQNKLPYLTVKDIDKTTAFDELVELLADSDYFIQNMDKDAGFIQVKFIMTRKKGLFSRDSGNRIMYNMLIKSSDNNTVRIDFQANVEKEIWNGEVFESSYYYRDEGVSHDPKDYEEIMGFIESHYEN